MEAKDTICQPFTESFGVDIAKKITSAIEVQAKISSEAGRQEGRREVMEWVNHNDICGEFSHVNMHYRSAWCAQLKAWRLEE